MKSPNNTKRILYLCGGRSFCSGDPSRKLAEVADCWQRAGHDVKHVCGGDAYVNGVPGGEAYGSQETYARWYRRVPGMTPLVTSVSEWRDIRHDRWMFEHLGAICSRWCPDVIWGRSCRLHCAGLTFARRIGVPYVLEWKDHLIDYRFSLFRGRALRMEARKNREAAYIVVESHVLRDQLGREGVDAGKIIVAHNAVQADQFSRDKRKRAKVRNELGVDNDTVLVGYLGSYAFYHDTARLVLAANIIRKGSPAGKTRILMVGAGKEYARSRQLAEDLELLDSVLIMKPGVPKEEVPGVLGALDIAVLPGSTDIICPIKVQEYMACELPSVVPDYACNREVIDDGRTGALFTPKDATALAGEIVALAQSRGLREAMGRRAREEVIRRFSWQATWSAALETVLERECPKSSVLAETIGE
jgi:glycosyltransferase involved in cell wall biosynthesis